MRVKLTVEYVYDIESNARTGDIVHGAIPELHDASVVRAERQYNHALVVWTPLDLDIRTQRRAYEAVLAAFEGSMR